MTTIYSHKSRMKLILTFFSIFIINSVQSQIPENKVFNFSRVSSEGKVINLEDYQSSYVLLDFWASWCRPCRKFSPKLLKLYNTFYPRGLKFIGISLDRDTLQWKQAILTDGLTSWPQILDDKIYTEYQVYTIPTSVLIGPNGQIIQIFGGGHKSRSALKKTLDKILPE